ncbi:hypothetical protein QFC22_004201 [Naganishia vaughanmartiniae]|uniref:Uncharacterized protein n=1 Tax=Naganishia vaughanmartiniae TaxID=1424756 RepID=A0ACC2X4G6_9TREE|nr:hypothetical protein QFC22_004201 [Naganishia vaughanmartiniae]
MTLLPQGRVLARTAVSTLVRTYAAGPPLNKDHHIISLPDSVFPRGYKVAATHSGVKKRPGVLDLGVLVSTSDRPCAAAACFTRNVFKAAPVVVSSQVLKEGQGRVRGFVVNSGCANAVTGKKGMEDAWSMSHTVTQGLTQGDGKNNTTPPPGTLVMSTGVIGQHLPINKITHAIPSLLSSLSSSSNAWMSLAKAFMTTDTFPKLRAREFQLSPDGPSIRIAGIDKGAGMIHPNMGPPHATLLGVIATDAAIHPDALQSALTYAVDRSFNSITVDGDMSTNDTILCLANGASSTNTTSEEITEHGRPKEFAVFRDELCSFAQELAQLVVRDGEGATKFVTVRVINGPSYDVSRAVACSVATSALVKTALYGQDANWGRILCAVGYTNLPAGTIDPSTVSVSFNPPASASNATPLKLLTNGEPEPEIDETRASELLKEEDLEIVIDLGVKEGGEEATYWTCDFSHEYVTINGDYRT